MKVLLTGATGFVGKVLVKELLRAGHEVSVLSRNALKATLILGTECRSFQWNSTSELPPLEAFEGCDAVINLMGETISKRWSDSHKQLMISSRIEGTRQLVNAMGKLTKKPSVFVSTSAVGIYGSRGDEALTESSPVADDFLATLCKDWEAEANKASGLGIRVALIRVGVVLGKNGGALEKMLPIFKTGMGGPVGSGKQYMSWIHVEDLALMFKTAMENKQIQGVYNATSIHPATNAEFSKELGKALHRPAFLPAPGIAMKVAFGEMSQILLEGQKVLPEKFSKMNFEFRYPTLERAFKQIVGN